MKKIIISVFVISLISMAFIPDGKVIGKQFSKMECEDYNGKKINLPVDSTDKLTLLGIAFSNDAEKELKLWIAPIYNKFASKNTDAFAASYDINFYFIPKFSLLNQVASKQSKEKIKSDTDKEMYPFLLFAGSKTLQKELELDKKDIPYLFLLDKTGKIVYAESGKYDSKKLDKIINAIDKN